jgi:hypothetical protein
MGEFIVREPDTERFFDVLDQFDVVQITCQA